MSEVTVMFTLPGEALEALQAKADRDGTAPGAILRSALRRELKNREVRETPADRDPAFVGALRTLLARDIVEARDWRDLGARLNARGYELRLVEGRLILYGRASGELLVDATEIGASYGALIRRFEAPIPSPKAAGGQ